MAWVLGGFGGSVDSAVETYGYAAVAVLVALESVFPPIPSEVVLPVAGFVAGRGDASVVGMVLAATLGSVVGAWVLYGAAAAIGSAVAPPLNRMVVSPMRIESPLCRSRCETFS